MCTYFLIVCENMLSHPLSSHAESSSIFFFFPLFCSLVNLFKEEESRETEPLLSGDRTISPDDAPIA